MLISVATGGGDFDYLLFTDRLSAAWAVAHSKPSTRNILLLLVICRRGPRF